jgi:hypothetical protein
MKPARPAEAASVRRPIRFVGESAVGIFSRGHVLASPKGERMSGLNMNQPRLVGLPRNWRVITVASLTTLGLAYGTGQSVLGDWWSLPKAQPNAAKSTVAMPESTERGISSTIHRLMTEARLYADKGEWDKAVHLAERAAKISEASSQLLSPASAYSPEKTARLVNELQARRDVVAKRVASARAEQTVADVATQSNRATPRSLQTASPFTSPPLRERPKIDRTVAEQPTGAAAAPRERQLAWAEELPLMSAPKAELLSHKSNIQPVAAQDPIRDTTPSPASPKGRSGWEDEAFSEELLLGKDSTSPASDSDTEPETSAANRLAPSFPKGAFPVQRVDQLRRRLETAASLNPGGAYSMPSRPTTMNAPDVCPPASPKSEFFTPTLSSDDPLGNSTDRSSKFVADAASVRQRNRTTMDDDAGSVRHEDANLERTQGESGDWMGLPDLNERSSQKSADNPETAPTEQPVIRIREYRVLPDHVRAALLKAAALPAAPTTRRHIVGYSEPMRWQSADVHDSGLPAMTHANRSGGGSNGSYLASEASWAPDLRDILPSARPSENSPAGQRVIPAVSVKQTSFRNVDLPSDSIQSTEPSGPALSAPDGTPVTDSSLTVPAGVSLSSTSRSPDSDAQSAPPSKRSTATRHPSLASKSKASHEVSRQSFALVEPLATALQLPVATTASLLGAAGLALLGLGLLLLRVAIRWRHS